MRIHQLAAAAVLWNVFIVAVYIYIFSFLLFSSNLIFHHHRVIRLERRNPSQQKELEYYLAR